MTATIPGQGDAATWPEHGPDPARVRAWISASLSDNPGPPGLTGRPSRPSRPSPPSVVGPVAVHRAHAWGVTARFRVDGGEPAEVVFKASFLPDAFGVAGPYRLLRACGAGGTPAVLAWRDDPGARWLLFRPFSGTPVGDLPGIDPLAALAAAMATIQARVAGRPDCHHLLPTGGVPVAAIPAMLDDIIPLAAPAELLPDAAERLAGGRTAVAAWARELEAGGWPISIHHVDLHPHNAVRLDAAHGGVGGESGEDGEDGEDGGFGNMLIYDWEEAGLGCPFFALDKLLLAAAERGGEAGASAVRAAYLEALPWRTRADRARALALAALLAPICFAHADAAFARALGWSPREAVAPWIPIALDRWRRAVG